MKKFFKEIGHQGFTIVEIMVALTLMVLLFTMIPMGGGDQEHAKLEEIIFDFDRAIKFSVNESILRNSVVRILIDLDLDPIEYVVEYGPSGNLVLPTVQDESRMSIKDRENQNKINKNLNSQFNRVDEFSDAAKKLPDEVQVIGLASSYLNQIRTEGKLAIYFYPTGEKDNSLIFFTTETELASLDIPPFENTTEVNYHVYSQTDLVSLQDSQENIMKEMYDKWIKD